MARDSREKERIEHFMHELIAGGCVKEVSDTAKGRQKQATKVRQLATELSKQVEKL